MAAYKSDINLFKAAGGERAKSKQVSKTKRLLMVVILVVIIVGGAAGGLYYYASTFSKELQKNVTLNNKYTQTKGQTTALLEELADVKQQTATQNAIEFVYTSNMWTAGMYSDLNEAELTAIRSFLQQEDSGYTYQYEFDDVIDSILRKLKLVAYDENVDNPYDAEFMYSALYYMHEMRDVFGALPLQYGLDQNEEEEDEYYWYCYYRGKVVMLLKSTSATGAGDVDGLVNTLQSGLEEQPFSTLAAEDRLDMSYKTFTVSLEGEDVEPSYYVVLALNSKTVIERFLDTVESVFAFHAAEDPTVEPYYYKAEEFYLVDSVTETRTDVEFHVTFSMNQSDYFHLTDVCNELYKTPYFANVPNSGFPEDSNNGNIERLHLVFMLKNAAVDAIHDYAIGYFAE